MYEVLIFHVFFFFLNKAFAFGAYITHSPDSLQKYLVCEVEVCQNQGGKQFGLPVWQMQSVHTVQEHLRKSLESWSGTQKLWGEHLALPWWFSQLCGDGDVALHSTWLSRTLILVMTCRLCCDRNNNPIITAWKCNGAGETESFGHLLLCIFALKGRAKLTRVKKEKGLWLIQLFAHTQNSNSFASGVDEPLGAWPSKG